MKHLIVGMLLGVLVGLALMGFGSPPTAAGRGQRTFTPIVITLVPGAPTTLRTRTPTARWTPVVITIVPGPTTLLATRTPTILICSRNKCP